jgi:hypothetical protein
MIRLVLAVAVAQMAVWWQPAGSAPSALIALGAVALAAAVLAVLSREYWPGPASTAGPLPRRAVALRRKSWSAAFQRQRDPDAAGRARPRAPSAAPAAA